MGLPEIKIKFREITKQLATRASRGIVAILLKDSAETGLHTIVEADDIPAGLSEANKGYINDILLGNTQDRNESGVITEVTYKPEKVLAYVIDSSDGTTDNALNEIANEEFNILCMPEAEEADNTKIIAFVKKMIENGNGIMAVVSTDTPPDHEAIINWQTDNIDREGGAITKTKYCARIAGLIAATPYTQSITYSILNDVQNIPSIENSAAGTAVDEGKLIAIKTAGAIRIARGVTSLTTTDKQTKGDSFKKIKLVQTYQLINNSIRKAIVEEYIGKVSNSYNNKVLLMSSIQTFLNEIANEGLIEANSSVEINMKKQKEYLKSVGVDVSKLTDAEIRQANTGSHVFISIKLKGIDAMEDFDVDIEV